MSLELVPVEFSDACDFIAEHHAYHDPPQGWKFGVGCAKDGDLVGVATVGRPVARQLDNGWTLEVTRCATDGTHTAASKLYAAAWRATRAIGYRRLVTYVLKPLDGTCLRAAGWEVVEEIEGGEWSRDDRPRADDHPTGDKLRFEVRTR